MRYAVSFIAWFDYELTIEFHEASSAIEAMKMHSKTAELDFDKIPDTIEAHKQLFFDCDSMCHAEPIPE